MCLEERSCKLCGTAFIFNATPSKVKAGHGVFCSGVCQRRGRRQRQLRDSFFARVGRSNQKGCLPRTGAIDANGYGHLGGPLAHRISWELYQGPIPEGLHVLHHCDNPQCVNPEHLFLGTNRDNIDDKIAKGRQAQGEMFNRKLTTAVVLRIRERAKSETQETIGNDLGVNQSHISRIVNRQIWKHI